MSFESLFCLAAGAMAWVAVPFFAVATAVRVRRWLAAPRNDVRLGIFGRDEPRWSKLGKDSLLFPQVLDLDRRMWGVVVLFHVAGIILFVGHLRLLFELVPLAAALGDGGMSRLAFVTGGVVGIVLLATVSYFLARRLTRVGRAMSTGEDYFLLVLALLVVLAGNNMRFFGEVPITAYREYIWGILSFSPRIPAGLESASAQMALGIHVLLANVFIFYLPLSKLVHFVGSLATNMIRSEYLWKRSYKRP